MSEFNPFESDFDPSVDPLTADEHGLTILAKLEEGEQLSKENSAMAPMYISHMGRLKKNLQSYSDYKRKRGEKLFSYEPEVLARNQAMGDEKLARSAVKLLQADEDTFNSIVEENGDMEDYQLGQSFMSDKSVLRKEYSLNQLLKQSGYNDHEILSGAAEQHMRQRLGAKEDSSEPTVDAYLRWSLSKINEVDRRKSISEAAIKAATDQFLGMTGGGAAFEEAIEKTNPDISRDERRELRRMRNLRFQELENDEGFKVIRPLVRKTANTIFSEEGLSLVFNEEGDEPFENTDQAIKAMGAIPKEHFGKLLFMLSKTAEAHGQDVDGFMNKLGKNLSRSFEELGRSSSISDKLHTTDILAKDLEEGAAFAVYRDQNGQVVHVKPIVETPTPWSRNYPKLGDKKILELENQAQRLISFAQAGDERRGYHDRFLVRKLAQVGATSFEVIQQGDAKRKDLKENLEYRKRVLEYTSEIYNWREAIADVSSDNIFVDNMVYGVARSLPEMGVMATGTPGMLLIANAQKERNMAEYRRQNPDASWEEAETSSWVGASTYTLVGRWGLTQMTKKLPNTNKLIGLGGEFVKRLGVEVLEENIQDLSFAATLEIFGALDEDIKDFDFINKDGSFMDSELGKAVERAPKTILAAMPLVAGGMMGRGAVDYFDHKTFENLFRDSELLTAYGFDQEHMSNIRELSTEDALDYIKENNSEFLAEMQELDMPQVTTNAQVSIDAENNFVITSTPSEAVKSNPLKEDVSSFEISEPVSSLFHGTNREFDNLQGNQKDRRGRENFHIYASSDASAARMAVRPDEINHRELFEDIEENSSELDAPYAEEYVGQIRDAIKEGAVIIDNAEGNVVSVEEMLDIYKQFGSDVSFSVSRPQNRIINFEARGTQVDLTSKERSDFPPALAQALGVEGVWTPWSSDNQRVYAHEGSKVLQEWMQANDVASVKVRESLETSNDGFSFIVNEDFISGERSTQVGRGEESTVEAPERTPRKKEKASIQVESAFKATTPQFITQTYKAKSPEEAAEVLQQVDPEFTARFTEQTPQPEVISEPDLARLSAQAMAEPESLGGDPIRWSLPTEPTLQVDKPVSHPEITSALEGVLKAVGSNTPIRFSGREVSKHAKGVYYLKQKMIRVRKHNNVTTVAHEVAHAIEDQFLEGGIGDDKWVKVRKANTPMAQELDKMGNDLYKGKAPANTTMSEGFAEYFRMLIEGHDMGDIAPNTHNWFEKNVLIENPHIQKAVEKAKETAVKYAEQGSVNRGKAGVVKSEGRVERLKRDGVDFIKGTPDQFVDMLFPIKRIVDAAETQLGKELKNNPYETASQLRMTHDAIVKYMVEEGMRDFTGNSLGPNTSLKSAVELIGDQRKEFTIYLWAKRTLALEESGRETGLSLDDANKIFEELNSPTFEAAAARVYDWNNNVLQYAADSSSDYANVVQNIRSIDPGNYIPLFREFNALDKGYQRGAPGAHGAQLVKKLKGSTRRIKDPFESMISQARNLVLRANQRAVIEQVLDITEKVPDMGQFMFEVTPDNVPAAHRNVVDLMDEVKRALSEDGDLYDTAKQFRDIIADSDQADQMVTLWGQAYMPPNKLENPIIPIYRNGKRRWYEVDRTAYEALMGMEVYRLPKFFDMVVGLPNRMFKLGTTGYRASFSMVTNPLRDIRTLLLNTQSNAKVPELLGTWVKTMGESVVSALSGRMLSDTAWQETYRRLGLEMSTPLGEDTRPTQSAARKLFQGKVLRTVHPANILDYVRELFQYAESATRVTEMKLLAKEMGWNPTTDKLTPEIAQKLALAAKRVTTDFTAAGATMRMVNQVLPFSNAQVQGVRAHVRALKANPAKFMLRGAYGSAAAIGLWLSYKDEEWWKNMPMGEKYRYTYIPITTPDGSEELIRIPRAFEADGFFMALPVAMLDAIYEENPKETVEWAKEFVGSFEPSKPVLLTAYTEQKANRVEFFDRPIVPRSEEALDVEGFRHLQYGPHNTRFAIELGEIFDVSPRRVDHAIKTFTGGAGADFVALFGRGPSRQEGQKREKQLSDTPVIGTLFSSVGQSSYVPEPVDELYKKLDWANANRKIKGKGESKEERTQRLILRDATSMLSSISEIEKLEMKTAERRKLRAMKVQIAKEAVESFNSSEPNRRQFAEWKRTVKALKE